MTTSTWAKQHSKIGLMILAYVAFIGLGMLDGLLGVVWPSIRTSFPSLMGGSVHRNDLEIMPICLLAVYAGLFGLYPLSVTLSLKEISC